MSSTNRETESERVSTVPVEEEGQSVEVESPELVLSVLIEQRRQTPECVVLGHEGEQQRRDEAHSLSISHVAVVVGHGVQYVP